MFCQNGGRHSPHAGRDRSNAAYNGFYIVKFHIAAQFSVLANVDPHIYDNLPGRCEPHIHDARLPGSGDDEF